jgi:hypothetical protein
MKNSHMRVHIYAYIYNIRACALVREHNRNYTQKRGNSPYKLVN